MKYKIDISDTAQRDIRQSIKWYEEPPAKSNFYFFTTKQPVILSFLTKHNSLYFLLLTSKQDNERLDVNLLNKLIAQ